MGRYQVPARLQDGQPTTSKPPTLMHLLPPPGTPMVPEGIMAGPPLATQPQSFRAATMEAVTKSTVYILTGPLPCTLGYSVTQTGHPFLMSDWRADQSSDRTMWGTGRGKQRINQHQLLLQHRYRQWWLFYRRTCWT
jgi:hypothetical protein